MPIYEYACAECGWHFEELVRNGERVVCPECATANVERRLSVFAAHGTAAQPSFGAAAAAGGCCGGGCGCGH